MDKKPSGRGSAKLGGAALAIRKKLKGVKIIDWHELGQPGPEWITGTFESPIAGFKANLSVLTRLKELRDLNILINGTPRPDLAQINFTVRSQ
jgi:hypothetical protein